MKLVVTINFSTWASLITDFIKKFKPPKSHVISVHARLLKFHGESTILIFWLTDGRLVKTRDTPKTIM